MFTKWDRGYHISFQHLLLERSWLTEHLQLEYTVFSLLTSSSAPLQLSKHMGLLTHFSWFVSHEILSNIPNFFFYSHSEDVFDKLSSLDRESASSSPLPTDVDSIKRLRSRLEESRKSALESLRRALQDGEVLLEKLTVMKNAGTLDSRPGHILSAVSSGTLS